MASERIRSTRIESWSHLMEELYRDSWDAGLERHRSPVVFRGVSDCEHELATSLLRLVRDRGDASKLERHLIRNFRKYAHSEVAEDTLWNWLAVAAHHKLPTRLLDWSYSPLVAMHFATANLEHYDRDGVVWCVNHRETNKYLPEPLRAELEKHGSDIFTVEMLDHVAGTLDNLNALSDRDFVLYMEPPSLDERIVNQFALFSLVSSPERPLNEWLEENTTLSRRLIIPAQLKWEFRDKLDQAGITERLLFPGLDGLTAWLTRYYAPRMQGSSGQNLSGDPLLEQTRSSS